MRWRTRAVGCGVALGLAVACGSGTTRPAGELMLIISTDDATPQFDWIRVEIRAGDTVVHANGYDVGPKGYMLPASIGVAPTDDARRTVDIRVVARSGGADGEFRVLRDVRTQVPRDRIAAVPIILRASCFSTAREVARGVFESSCGEGKTCVAGSCSPVELGGDTLPEYTRGATVPVTDAAVLIDPTSLHLAKSGGTGTVRFRLASAPGADVAVALASSAPDVGDVDAPRVVLNKENWNTGVDVTVTGAPGQKDVPGDDHFEIRTAPADSSDGRYRTVDAPDIRVTYSDDIPPPQSFLSPRVPPGASFARAPSFRITTDQPTTSPALIYYTLDSALPTRSSASGKSPLTLPPIASGTTIRWFAANGSRAEPPQSFTVSIDAAGQNTYGHVVDGLKINGGGATAVVAAGSRVQFTASFQVWTDPSCPTCIIQVVYGLGTTPVDCLESMVTAVWPGITSSGTFTLAAPTTPGVYPIRVAQTRQYNCPDAVRENPLRDDSMEVGTIVVR